MSYHQFEVPPLSRRDIRRIARALRNLQYCAPEDAFDALRLLEHSIASAFPGFVFDIVEDGVLGEAEGMTSPNDGLVELGESVYVAAANGDGRARMTIIHEVAHFLLHQGVKLKAARVKSGQSIPRFRCSEWQADCLAAETLMTPSAFLKAGSVVAASQALKVSKKAASVQASIFKGEGLLPADFPTW